jgi:hypothetical protein
MSNGDYKIDSVGEEARLRGLRIMAKLIARRLLAEHLRDQKPEAGGPLYGQRGTIGNVGD